MSAPERAYPEDPRAGDRASRLQVVGDAEDGRAARRPSLGRGFWLGLALLAVLWACRLLVWRWLLGDAVPR